MTPDPAILQSLRDRLASLGFPTPDDLPEHLLPAVAAAWEDRARLDWVEGVRGTLGWSVFWRVEFHTPHRLICMDDEGLRDAIDAARAAPT